MNWNEISIELLREYYYDIFCYYPNEKMTKEDIITIIKKHW